MELQEIIAMPKPFGIALGSTLVHMIPAGRGRSERATLPVKS